MTKIVTELKSLESALQSGAAVADDMVLKLVQKIALESQGLVLIIDELGKVAEYVANSGGTSDPIPSPADS